MITHSELLNTFHYDGQNLIWKINKGNVIAGKIAGRKSGNGYIQITFNKKRYYAHRLIWFYHYGVWPNDQIDHINGNPADNGIKNLRQCNKFENHQNIKKMKNNSSGYTGVTKKRNKWEARIYSFGKYYNLGTYETKEEAYAVYCEAKKKYHSFHPIPISR